MDTLRFTFSEVLSLLGVAQCVYVLVYVSFRVENIKYVTLPLLYFLTLCIAFFLDFAHGYLFEITPFYDVLSWAAWAFCIPLSALLVLQLSKITSLPSLPNWLILLVVPAAYMFSTAVIDDNDGCFQGEQFCPELFEWLNITGLISGAMSLLLIWMNKDVFEGLLKQSAGKERYWLILALIVLNIFFLALVAFSSASKEASNIISLIRTILGLSFIYLVSTSLFRIYPSALILTDYKKKTVGALNDAELIIAEKIESLFNLDKVYQESAYSRSDLAREVGVSDSIVSKVINVHFNKSFPQLLSSHRVNDAKILLLDTDASIKIVAEEVGFNSIATFNRVFKDIIGQSPSEYRKNTIK